MGWILYIKTYSRGKDNSLDSWTLGWVLDHTLPSRTYINLSLSHLELRGQLRMLNHFVNVLYPEIIRT